MRLSERVFNFVHAKPSIIVVTTVLFALVPFSIYAMTADWKLYTLGNFYPLNDPYAIQDDAVANAVELGDAGEVFQVQQTQSVSKFVVTVLVLPPVGDQQRDGNALERKRLELLQEMVRIIEQAPGYADFCVRTQVNATHAGACSSPLSLAHATGTVAADGTLVPSPASDVSVLHVTSGGANVPVANRDRALSLVSTDYTTRTFGQPATQTVLTSPPVTGTRLYESGARPTAWASTAFVFSSGFPLAGFTNKYQREAGCVGSTCPMAKNAEGKTQNQLASAWQVDTLYTQLHQFAERHEEDAQILFHSRPLTDRLVSTVVTNDILWSLGACGIVFFVLWSQLDSAGLAAAGLSLIVLSFPLAWFVYGAVFGFQVMTQLNLLCIFIAVAVGADDVMVMTDSYKQAIVENKELAHQPARLMQFAWTRAIGAMLVTSSSTSAAFFATTTSSMPSIRALGLFCGLTVLAAFVLVSTLYTACLTLYYKYGHPERPSVWQHCSAAWSRRRERARQRREEAAQESSAERNNPTSTTASNPDLPPLPKEPSFRPIEQFFYGTYAPFIYRFRYAIVGVCVLLTTGMGFSVSQLQLMQRESRFFPDDWYAIKLIDIRSGSFPTGSESDITTASLVFGIQGIDRSSFDSNDEENKGFAQLDPDFDAKATGLLPAMLQLCTTMRSASWASVVTPGQVACWPEALQAWCRNTTAGAAACGTARWPPTNAGVALNAFFSDTVSPLGGGNLAQKNLASSVFLRQSKVLWWRLRANTTIPDQWTVPDLRAARSTMEDLEAEAKSLTGYGGAFEHTDSLWVTLEMIDALLTGTITGLGISMSLAAVMLLIATRNWRLTVIATTSIAATVVCIVGMYPVMGWNLEIVESLCTSIIAGMSVDYVAHYSVAWGHADIVCGPAKDQERLSRLMFTMRHLGGSVTGGAATSLLATVFLWPASLLLLQRFGQIVLSAILLAFVFSNTFFVGMLAIAGPTGGMVDPPFSWIAAKCARKRNIAAAPVTTDVASVASSCEEA